MSYLSNKQFNTLTRIKNLIPVITEHPVCEETPVSFYEKLKPVFGGCSFLLETAEKNKSQNYSFLGFESFLTYSSKNNKGKIKTGSGDHFYKDGPPTEVLSELINYYNIPDLQPFSHFFGGAVGYFSYDTVRSLEELPSNTKDTLNLPDSMFMFPSVVIIFDHGKNVIKVVTLACTENEDSTEAYNKAIINQETIKDLLYSEYTGRDEESPLYIYSNAIETNISREKHLENVQKALEYIQEGDILQVVLSRRYSIPVTGSKLEIYKRLRAQSASPYMFFLDFKDPVILGASPEMLVRANKDTVETRPIAGTRPRYKDPLKERETEKELLEDEKERAEHLMLVDLGRNDLGRVCRPGSVEVPQFMEVEKFSHVMHLVSRVTGKLDSEKHPLKALEACFPAGTVSGAPKVRAMEIIDELEPDRRNIYAGAVGYVGFGNIMDTAIAIRTMVISGGKAYIQTGGGIVSDSVPEMEYRETIKKAAGLMQVLGIEENGGLNDDFSA